MESKLPKQQIDLKYLHTNTTSHDCGYCKKNQSFQFGFTCKKMSPQIYKNLMDCGWRRCGKYFYKPDLFQSCCKSYTIRTNIAQYEMRKSHKKVIKKWNKFIYEKDKNVEKIQEEHSLNKPEKVNKIDYSVQTEEQINLRVFIEKVAFLLQKNFLENENFKEIQFDAENLIKNFKILPSKKGNYFTNYLMILFAKNKKLYQENMLLFQEIYQQNIPDYQILLETNGQLNIIKKQDAQKPPSIQKNQCVQQKNPDQQQKIEEKQENNTDTDTYTFNQIKKGKLTIKIQLAKSDETNYNLYKNYCSEIHNKKEKGIDGFSDFLCQQCLNFSIENSLVDKSVKLLLGCFHMNYYIDEKLIAVGVIDIFSEGLSSVYFFYDPLYKKYSLGTIAAVYEIEYVQYMSKFFQQFQYYYLGFYIQDCQKMLYKAEYGPNELLCPRTYNYVRLDEKVREFIDKKGKDPSLSDTNEGVNSKMVSEDVSRFVQQNTQCMMGEEMISYTKFVKNFNPVLKSIFEQFAQIIDKNTYSQLIFKY